MRATGPMTSKSSSSPGSVCWRGQALSEGFSPTRPVCEAGRRIEPPPSCAMASGPMPAATAATAPPLEPPGVSAGFQGLPVAPNSGFAV